ncbi:ribonuclease H-like domain-containing protein, partial [Tanacetum coccineum]
MLALTGQRLNAITAIGEVILLENAGHQGIMGIEIEMLQQGRTEIENIFQAEEGITNFALMAYTSQGSSSSDSEHEALNKSNLEIIGYQMGLESLEARIVVYEKNEAVYEEDIAFLKYDVQTGLGFDEQVNESEVLDNVFDSHESDGDDNPVNKRFKSKDIVEKPKIVRPCAPIIEEWDIDSDNDSVFRPKSNQTKPKFTKINFVKFDENVKSVNKENTHRQVKYPRKTQSPRANAAKQSSPRAAASISTARPVNTTSPKSKVNDALPITYSYFKAHSPVRRAFNHKSSAKTNNEKVNTTRVNNVTTAGPKAEVSAAVGNGENVVKSSTCWIWRPTGNVIDHTSKNSGSYMLKRFDYVDLQGRLKHMTGNKFFLTDYQEIDGGFVAFAGSPKGGKITGKGKIRTGKSDFEDVYFVKELKFNLFSVSQMCDKKNSVLFTETECLVLSPDFNLLDESQVLLKVPRHDNMYSFDLKNVVLSGENQINHKVKIIKCDNGIEFKNNDMNQFCGMKGIKREFSVFRTPQQNEVAERKNRTLIEAARTMLVDSLLPTTFWAEAVNTACYVQNRVLVTKPHNKTPYELLLSIPVSISFMRPFRCLVAILNTLDPLGKFDGKADEGFLVGYSINSKAFKVFNTRTRKVEENLHINFLKNKPNVAGSGPEWLFDIDSLTKYMNYEPVTVGNQTNSDSGIETNVNAGQAG